MDAVEPSRRDRKKVQTRDELIFQATRLFDAHGFDAVTTEQISEAADVSQRTFFRHQLRGERVEFQTAADCPWDRIESFLDGGAG